MWTFQRSGDSLLWLIQWKARSHQFAHKGRKRGHNKIGSPAGDAGPHDPENAACAWAAARVRDCPAHRTGEWRHSPVERGNGIHLVTAAATARMYRSGMGNIGEQPQGEVLLPHQARTEAA